MVSAPKLQDTRKQNLGLGPFHTSWGLGLALLAPSTAAGFAAMSGCLMRTIILGALIWDGMNLLVSGPVEQTLILQFVLRTRQAPHMFQNKCAKPHSELCL